MSEKLIPIYTTKGDAEAFLNYPYIFNRNGEWIGFVAPNRDVYSALGFYVGTLTDDPRILRKRAIDSPRPNLTPPARPPKAQLPATIPLPPMMSELTYSQIDVLLDEPERLHTLDTSDYVQDMD